MTNMQICTVNIVEGWTKLKLSLGTVDKKLITLLLWEGGHADR